MKRNWQQGDVALMRCRDGVERVAMLTDRGNLSPLWIAAGEDWGRLHDDVPVRPLVVIDVEDRSAAIKVAQAVGSVVALPGEDISHIIDAVQRHLRSLVTPPRPEEPLDPAIRVFAAGSEWARVGPWWACAGLDQVPRCWDYLTERDDFRVLSPETSDA